MRYPPSPNFCAFATLGSISDSRQSINLAQLVYLVSVALSAELVSFYFLVKLLLESKEMLSERFVVHSITRPHVEKTIPSSSSICWLR